MARFAVGEAVRVAMPRGVNKRGVVGVSVLYTTAPEARFDGATGGPGNRTLVTLRFFWNAPQSDRATETTGYRGLFYHFLDVQTGRRVGEVRRDRAPSHPRRVRRPARRRRPSSPTARGRRRAS